MFAESTRKYMQMRRFLRLAVVAFSVIPLLCSCDNSKSTNSTDDSQKITSGIVGTWLEGTGTSEVTFNDDGSGVKKTLSNGAVTYTGGFMYVIPSEGNLRVTDNKTGDVDVLRYWLSTNGSALTVVDQSSDTSRWTRKGASGSFSTTIPWNSSISYGSLTDSREGQTYKTVTIGMQTWMAENLNYKVDSSWCYENSADSCAKYGRLYTWASVMKLPDSCNSTSCASQVMSMHRGACPSGWHVPSDDEWAALEDYIKDSVAARLKSTAGWLYTGDEVDAYGFRALPAGYRDDRGFNGVGSYANFWSSSEDGTDLVLYCGLVSGDNNIYRYRYLKKSGYGVRCLKDMP